MRYFRKLDSGQSIIEVVIALSLVAIVVLALVRVTISSIQNSSFARDQQAATKYAQEGLENARKLRGEDESEFWSKSGTETETIGNFERTVTYTPFAGEEDQKMEVRVVVSWEDNKGLHQSDLSTYLTKWK